MSEQDAAGCIADVFRFAANGGRIGGEIPVACMSRLTDSLVADRGVVHWQFSGSLDTEGQPRLSLVVSGKLALRCQRCLGELDWELAIEATLLPVRVGQDLPEDELENDEIDVIEVDGEFDVLSLVEDEIILALPMAPRHVDCGFPQAVETDGDGSPFSVLASLRS